MASPLSEPPLSSVAELSHREEHRDIKAPSSHLLHGHHDLSAGAVTDFWGVSWPLTMSTHALPGTSTPSSPRRLFLPRALCPWEPGAHNSQCRAGLEGHRAADRRLTARSFYQNENVQGGWQEGSHVTKLEEQMQHHQTSHTRGGSQHLQQTHHCSHRRRQHHRKTKICTYFQLD